MNRNATITSNATDKIHVHFFFQKPLSAVPAVVTISESENGKLTNVIIF